uniref:Alpha-1,3-mannosyl-glycoprotein 4-beta-N-acetylglucosaminyltransferase B n=1 Tax=Cyprinus carpio TaxID=7962 RepID=A0A8C1MRW6_CYPCA
MRLRNGTFLTVSLFGLCGLISLSWYTAFSNSKGNVVDIYQREFLALRDRLHSKEALKEGREKTPKYQRTEDGFIRIGRFDNGIAEGEVDASFGPLEALRLSVLTDSPVWVILINKYTVHKTIFYFLFYFYLFHGLSEYWILIGWQVCSKTV